jgi:FtsP/CotA-like multicopper oxidase with cupredoxin domain
MKRFVVIGAVVIATLVTAVAIVAVTMYSRADTSNVGELEFTNELHIPPLLDPKADESGRKVVDLQLQAGETEFLAGKPAETWGVNGSYLGPTLRAERGDDVQLTTGCRRRRPSTGTACTFPPPPTEVRIR